MADNRTIQVTIKVARMLTEKKHGQNICLVQKIQVKLPHMYHNENYILYGTCLQKQMEEQ